MNLLLTGPPGVGKSTIVRRVIADLPGPVGGFVTDELRERSQRVGFRIVALDSKETATLAHVGMASPFRLGKYGVSVEAMNDVAVRALRRALGEAELIVIDEIGRMECFAPNFLVAVNQCLDSPKPVLATISHHRLPFLDAVRDRDDVELIEVTAANRAALPAAILARLRSLLQRATTATSTPSAA